jgi:hypothetical protein
MTPEREEFPGKKGLTRGVPPVSAEGKNKREKQRGEGVRGLAGLDWVPGTAQVGLLAFSLFFVLFPFLFSVFYFFHRFCLLNPNKVKPNSNLF